jgi:hypothetical protein
MTQRYNVFVIYITVKLTVFIDLGMFNTQKNLHYSGEGSFIYQFKHSHLMVRVLYPL